MNHTKSIDGRLLRQLLLCGFENLNSNVHYLNDINVFPVSDSDTGTNLRRTFEMGINELAISPSFSEVFSSFIQGMLIGSRGNSGSILSQYFLGIYEETKGKDEVTVFDFCKAMEKACVVAYQAVLQPIEGTILTAMRESIDNTIPQISTETSLEQFFDVYSVELFQSVQNTTNRLDILRLNNVVDSGAAGFYLIVDGMKSGLHNATPNKDETMLFITKNAQEVSDPLTFRYCTEFLMKMHAEQSRAYFAGLLESKGDSLIVTVSDGLLKIHIHTNEPQNILDEFSMFGEYIETKIDDMLVQQKISQYTSHPRKHNGYVIISFAHGDGIIQLFDELGCDIVFNTTQNYQLNEDNFHFFINKFIDEQILLLPNDETIYATAIALYPPSKYPNVHVIDSQNVMKSYFLLSFMIGTDVLSDVLGTFSAYEHADFFVARILSITIQQKKFFVGFTTGETIINDSLDELLVSIASPEAVQPYSSIIVFHGQTARTDEIAQVSAYFDAFDGKDFAMIDGRQDDFDYIIGAM
ncbi:MAG: DAK2 domain-containing protein [Coriobacteriia bacterium]|nr:DAK2 domain-containing protein [Coriobacteriia bacterium]